MATYFTPSTTANGRLQSTKRARDSHRDEKAAKKFFLKLLKGLRCIPRVVVTDKLRSYHAAIAEVLPGVAHLQQKYQNNRAENSHQPTRLRELIKQQL